MYNDMLSHMHYYRINQVTTTLKLCTVTDAFHQASQNDCMTEAGSAQHNSNTNYSQQ